MVGPADESGKKKPVGEEPCVGQDVGVNLESPDIKMPGDLKDLEAKLTRPSGKKEPVECSEGPDDSLAINFVPEEPGKHVIDVTKNGKPVKGSPFEVMVGPAPGSDEPSVGKPCEMGLDIPELNLPDDLKHLKAKLTRPTGKEDDIPCSSNPDGTLGLEFTPTEEGKHVIDVTKRGRPVKGSPFEVMVGPAQPSVGKPCDMGLDIPELNLPEDLKHVKAKLTRPTGKEDDIPCSSNPDGTLALEFTPTEPGKHVIEVTKRGRPVKGSPFEVMVGPAEDSPDDGSPQVGKQLDVDLDIPEITLPRDLRNVEAELVRPNGKSEPLKTAQGPDEHTLSVGFVPEEPGEHLVDVKKRGRPVAGSPFPIQVGPASGDKPGSKKPKRPVIDEVVGQEQVRGVEEGNPDFFDDLDKPKEDKPATVGSPCDVNLDVDGVNLPDDLDKLKAELTRPSGKQEAVPCGMAPDGSLAISFTPEEVGKHLLEVKKNRRPVKGSPFEIMVEEAVAPGSKPTVGNK
jgi:filamin